MQPVELNGDSRWQQQYFVLTLQFPVSSQLVCEEGTSSQRALYSWSVCLICWVHHWAQVMCTGALGKNLGTTLLCILSFLSPFWSLWIWMYYRELLLPMRFFFFKWVRITAFEDFWSTFNISFRELCFNYWVVFWQELLHLERFYSFYHLLLIRNWCLYANVVFPNVRHLQTSFMDFCHTQISSVLLFIQYLF